jgi:hypothetical protein
VVKLQRAIDLHLIRDVELEEVQLQQDQDAQIAVPSALLETKTPT